jgi:RimJ/RimL family protein N-acetyltransferase
LESGFGYCALKDGSIAGFCTSEYLSNTSCGIGIETYEPYQKLGVAKAMTSRMLNYCMVMEKTPYWDCWKNNIASARTAEGMGFEKLADYDIVFVRFI